MMGLTDSEDDEAESVSVHDLPFTTGPFRAGRYTPPIQTTTSFGTFVPIFFSRRNDYPVLVDEEVVDLTMGSDDEDNSGGGGGGGTSRSGSSAGGGASAPGRASSALYARAVVVGRGGRGGGGRGRRRGGGGGGRGGRRGGHGGGGDPFDSDSEKVQEREREPQPATLTCRICLDDATQAVVTPCGHVFCWACLYRWLSHSGKDSCPLCNGYVEPSGSCLLYTSPSPRDRG